MNIQLSVTVWTVICFVALMLILHFLLLKPVLKVMDDRRRRIQDAAEKKAEHERLSQEYALRLEEQKAARESAQRLQAETEIEKIRAKGKKAVEAAKEDCIREVDDYRLRVDAEHTEILRILNDRKDKLAAIFASSITKE